MSGAGPTRGDLLWPSIPAMALDAAARFGDAVAVVDRGRRITFTNWSPTLVG